MEHGAELLECASQECFTFQGPGGSGSSTGTSGSGFAAPSSGLGFGKENPTGRQFLTGNPAAKRRTCRTVAEMLMQFSSMFTHTFLPFFAIDMRPNKDLMEAGALIEKMALMCDKNPVI